MWLRTVSTLRCSSAAISSVFRPCSSNRSTSRLTGRQMWMRGPRRALVDVGDLPEHTDDPVTFEQRHAAQLDADPLAVGTDHDEL